MGATPLLLAAVHDEDGLSGAEMFSCRRRKSGSPNTHSSPSEYSAFSRIIKRYSREGGHVRTCARAIVVPVLRTVCQVVSCLDERVLFSIIAGSRRRCGWNHRGSKNTGEVAARTGRHSIEFSQYNARSCGDGCMVDAHGDRTRSRMDDGSFGVLGERFASSGTRRALTRP